MTSLNEIVLWYLVSTLASLAFAPAVLTLFRRSTDRGASLTRPLSALLLVWPAWYGAGLGSGLVPFAPVTLWATVALGGAASWFWGIRSGALDGTAIRHLLIAEAGFLVAFAAFTWFHGYGPQLTDQEKLSDLMMLSSTMRAEQMPPADAWLAGETINYYYVGYVVWAGLARLIDTTPAIAFNLALSSVFATTVITAAGLAGNVLGHWFSDRISRIGGILAVAFVLGGHPWGVFRILENPRAVWDTFFFDFAWQSSRIIDRNTRYEAITELPAFSFTLADLHPHLLALPYTVTALACAWLLATLEREDGLTLLGAHWPRLVLAGWITGALYAMNSWDYPTYLLVALLALVVGTRGHRSAERLGAAAIVLVSSIALWLPFHAAFEAPTRSSESGFADVVQNVPVIGGILASLASVTGDRTQFGDYVSIFGFTWVIALVVIALEFWKRQDREHDSAMLSVGLAGAVVMILGAILLPMPLLAICGLPIIAILLLWERDASLSAANVALALFGLAFALTLVPEFVFLLDIFGARMNTIFKLYYQAWTLCGLAAAVGLVVIWERVQRWNPGRIIMPVVVTALVLGLLTYPVVIGNQWLNWRNAEREWLGMDGLASIPSLGPDEHASIEWLWNHAADDDVMLAAGGCEWSNVVSHTASASGVQSLLGWPAHERQWHLGEEDIDVRIADRSGAIETLGESLDPALVDRYGITLLYLGPAELEGTNAKAGTECAPGPFPGASDPSYPGPGWSEVFSQGDIRIFRKNGT